MGSSGGRLALGGYSRALRAAHHLLQPVHALELGWDLGQAAGGDDRGLRRRYRDDRQVACPSSSTRRCAQKKKAKSADDSARGRSRGGLTTKIHALVDAEGRPIKLGLPPGQNNDSTKALPLLDDLDKGSTLLADRAYDTDAIRAFADERGAWANIPPKSNRNDSFAFSRWVYRQRNLVERFFNKIKQFRGIATRYDRKAENFLAAIKLVAVRLWLRFNESTA